MIQQVLYCRKILSSDLRLALACFGQRAVRTWPAKGFRLQKVVAPAVPLEFSPTLLESALGRQTTERRARMTALHFSFYMRLPVAVFSVESKFAYSENDATSVQIELGKEISLI